MDLQHLRASDGTGEAVLAHIQTVRNPGSTVLDLDNVDNWNTKAVIITGTPAANGFVSPVGMKVMYGHLSAGDFIIDGYAPGFVDNGNTTAEVAIVKMTTSWADTLVNLLEKVMNDDGSLKTLWTQYAPANSGFSSTSTNVGRYSRVGSIASVYLIVVGTSNSGYIGLELPYPPKSTAFIPARVLSGGVNLDDPGMIEIIAGSTAAVVYRSFSGGTFVASGAKALHPINFTYEIDE
jgi:hypothetical protein